MDKMKRIPQLLVLGLLAISLIACATAQAAPATEPQDAPLVPLENASRTITVVGVGTVNLVPDVARINVGAEVRADTVSEAKGEVDRQIAAIRAALAETGVEAKDIQTNHYSIHSIQFIAAGLLWGVTICGDKRATENHIRRPV
jgi:uncharacterized protein YggE